jgi:uncharacterized membrane protein YqgA involved in biofilm formation
LQRFSNQLGQAARQHLATANPNPDAGVGPRRPPAEGFKVCAALFCAAPLGVLGAVQDGLSQYWYPLGIKAVMEGLAVMGFVRMFGWGVLLSALPVLAWQGTVTLVCSHWLGTFLAERHLLDAVNATGGLLVFSVALLILQIKRFDVADYLPSLLIAPVLAWLWR